jgi:hypothetical protein
MICYQDDWKYFPNAIADTDTKNTTYIEYCALLEKMGIKNNLVYLALHDRDLVGVDPWDPNLDDEMKIKIARECSVNFWYFLREVFRVEQKGSIERTFYTLNRLNAAFHWLYLQNVSTFVVGIRQCGKSLCADIHHIAYLDFYARNYSINVIVNTSSLRQSSTDKRIGLRRGIPSYISSLVDKGGKRDKENTDIITCNRLGNELTCKLASDKRELAEQAGRGLTSACRQIDEGPHCSNIHISLGIAEMGGGAAIRTAKENGTPYGTCITTTPGDLTTTEGAFMYNIYSNAMPWTEKLYDCKNRDEMMQVIASQTAGKSEYVNITMYHHNLGYTDDWLASEIIRTNATERDIQMDLLLEWGKGNLLSPLSKDATLRIAKSEIDPLYTEVNKYKYVCRWYCKQEEIHSRLANGKYILSLDPSELAGRDIHGLTLTNTKDMSCLMVCSPNEGNTFNFTKFIFEFLMEHPNVLFVLEAKSTGASVIDTLIAFFVNANVNPFRRIYSTIFDSPNVVKENEKLIYANDARGTIETYSSFKGYFGISTTKKIRDYVYNNLLVTIGTDFGHNIKDREVSKQIRGLAIIKGRVDHPSGGHDDLVISWLLAAYVLRMSTNLWFYGIDTSSILKGRFVDKDTNPEETKIKEMSYEEERVYRFKQAMHKRELESLIKRYQNTNNISELSVLEYQIKDTHSKIKDEDMDLSSFGAIIESVKREYSNNNLMNIQRKQNFINNLFELFKR